MAQFSEMITKSSVLIKTTARKLFAIKKKT